jgi:hypothetical protein
MLSVRSCRGQVETYLNPGIANVPLLRWRGKMQSGGDRRSEWDRLYEMDMEQIVVDRRSSLPTTIA